MVKRKQVFIIIGLLAVLLTCVANASEEYSLFDPLVDVCNLVHKHYVTDANDAELVAGAINGMLHQLDPYSEYIPAADVEDFQKRTSGTYEGLGIGIDIKDGGITVISPFQDSPAYEAGILPGDRIVEIGGQLTKGWSSTKAVKALTGQAGTKVNITVVHLDGSEETLTITRQYIHVPTVRGYRRNTTDGNWDYIIDPVARIGYVRITQFTTETAQAFSAAIETLLDEDIGAIVLDLRNNPGGLMSAAVDIIDKMVDQGVIVSMRGAHTTEQTQYAHPEGTYRKFHLVIIIDQGSASASEIVAGSLQDHNRAVIVGKRSWGKGSVQRVMRLPDSGDALKLTTDHYYLPKGRCVHRLPEAKLWGVDPDVEEELNPDNFTRLRELMRKLSAPPSPKITDGDDNVDKPDKAKCVNEPDESTPADEENYAKELLQLDNQLDQAVKQCKGLLRAKPTLKGLAETFAK